ncbi:MAG: fasciclin domain-containing protein [Pseudomonadota bacterium]
MVRKTLSALAISAFAALPAVAQDAPSQDIVDIAAGAGTFSTLVAAVEAADLVETLKGDGPFTVFAPTDEAFAALPEGTVETLLLDENKQQLIEILTFHVVPEKVMSSDLAGKTVTAATVNGERLNIDARNGVDVNGASVTQADIEATNGVIHVVDTVILPGT